MQASVTAILVTHNSAGVVGRAIASIADNPLIARIVVVDNASSDDTHAELRRDFPTIDIIDSKENLGFGRANNLALEQVKTPYALLLNPDAILHADALAELVNAFARYPDAAILAPQLRDEDDEIHESYKRSVFVREARRFPYHEPAGDVCAEFLSGAVWLMRMEAFRETGFFDPNIFLFYEDDDLCLRAHKAGHALVLVASAHATHLMGKSSPHTREQVAFRQYHLTCSRIYMEQKYHGRAAALLFTVIALTIGTLKWLLGLLTLNLTRERRYRARLAGMLGYWFTRSM